MSIDNTTPNTKTMHTHTVNTLTLTLIFLLIGASEAIIPDLQHGRRVRGMFENYFRMDESCFQEILHKIRPIIRRLDTPIRNAISPQQRLAVTLRYFATGNSYTALYYDFRISVSSLALIIPETCLAIYDVLKEHHFGHLPHNNSGWISVINCSIGGNFRTRLVLWMANIISLWSSLGIQGVIIITTKEQRVLSSWLCVMLTIGK